MSPRTLRRILVALPVLISGCAAYQQPELLIPAGSRVCYGNTASCESLFKIADELNSKDMTARICAAGAMTSACK